MMKIICIPIQYRLVNDDAVVTFITIFRLKHLRLMISNDTLFGFSFYWKWKTLFGGRISGIAAKAMLEISLTCPIVTILTAYLSSILFYYTLFD